MRTFTTTLILLSLVCFSRTAGAQGSVKSKNGYTVNLSFVATSIETSSKSCKWGYNYNVNVDYEIKFTGSNQPKKLYTLYGYYICGGKEHYFDLPETQDSGTTTSTSNVWRSESDCNTATTSSLECDEVIIVISGPGISQQKYRMSGGALPVKFANVRAEKLTDLIAVNWQTLTEINNNYFTVERSLNGVDFEEVATVDGAGNSNEILSYSYHDLDAPKGVVYYRIKQTDFDGQFDYSDLVVVNNEMKDGELVAYPNPNRNSAVTLQLGYSTVPRTVEIIDLRGQLIHQFTSNQPNTILPSLRTGIYIIKVTKPNGFVQSTRFIQE